MCYPGHLETTRGSADSALKASGHGFYMVSASLELSLYLWVEKKDFSDFSVTLGNCLK